MSTSTAIEISHLGYRYGNHEAIRDLSLAVAEREIFALLGPNGSGKTTLFRVLSTLIPPQVGDAQILGLDLRRQPELVRAQLGVVFQAASVDKKLTVWENVVHHGRLYGLGGRELKGRADEMLARLGLEERRHDLVETLSGGLRRRVELAQSMLHRPRVLLLDEPSTGLDPGARSDLWQYLHQERASSGVTIMLTTHLLDEAERADRIGIMHRGELAALDTPAALQAKVGGDAITIRTKDPAGLAAAIGEKFHVEPMPLDGSVRLEQPEGHQWIARLVEAFPEQIDAVTLGKPTLEDVFIHVTGHQFWNEEQNDKSISIPNEKRAKQRR
jgi:ABC-2 type transport system ATP-binding protein